MPRTVARVLRKRAAAMTTDAGNGGPEGSLFVWVDGEPSRLMRVAICVKFEGGVGERMR